MRSVGAKFLRIMSWPNDKESPWDRAAWKAEVVKRLRELAPVAEAEGVILAHENCSGYGESPEGFLELIEAVDSPAFKLIIDTGNNSLHHNDNEATWDYYTKCRAHIVHVHIKSAKPNPAGGDWITCHVDEDPVQRRILEDLEGTGYNGWLSIEPHIKAAIHAGQDVDDTGEARRVWVEYTRRLEKLVKEITG
jgi:sugar phosphate isomerase/epimerase